MDLRNPLLLLCIGFILGLVVAEAVYYFVSPVVLSDGSVQVLVDGDYYTTVSDLISGAQNTVHVAMFSANYQTDPEYREGHVNQLLEQLVALRNKGIEVSVIMDDWPEGNSRAVNYLEKNNVPVKLYSGEGTLHAKLIIIDGKIVIVGSTNWSHHSIDKNHEANVIINNEGIAQEFESYFTSLIPS